MQISTAEQVKELWPDAEVIISTPFPEVDQNLYKKYKIIKSTRRNLPYSTLQIVRAKMYMLFKKARLDLKSLINNEELSHFQDADLIIDLSGDTLTEDYGPHVTYSHFLPIWLGLSFKKPVFVCAQSIGPFKLTMMFSRRMLNKVSRVTAREKITYEYLKNVGIRSNNLGLTSDMAFLLKPADDKSINEILKKEGVKLDNNLVLGVTISDLVAKRFDRNDQEGSLITNVSKLLDRFTKEKNAVVLLLGHVTGPSEAKNDRLVANKIRQEMDNKESAYVINGDYTPGELKGIISYCDIFMGSRMHSNIAALSSLVPTLAIGYSHKTLGIMTLFGMEKYVVDIDSLENSKLSGALNDLEANKNKLKSMLEQNLPGVKNKSKENVTIIKKLVNRGSI